jgi:replicative DNA helicase
MNDDMRLVRHKAIIGTLIKYNNSIPDARGLSSWEDPFYGRLSDIYGVINKIYDMGEKVTVSSVIKEVCAENNTFNSETWSECVRECTKLASTSNRVKPWVDDVVSELTCRRIKTTVESLKYAADDESATPERLVDLLESTLVKLRKNLTTGTDGGLDEAFEEIEQLINVYGETGEVPFIKTGLWTLDKVIGGFSNGEYIGISALSGRGKSALATSIMLQMAYKKVKTAFISLEMDKLALTLRLWQQRTGYSLKGQMQGGVGKAEDMIIEMERAKKFLGDSGMQIVSPSSPSVMVLKSHCRNLVHSGVEVLFIDYLQLVQGDSRKSREQELSAVSEEFRRLALELQVPIVMLSQQNSKALDGGPNGETIRETRKHFHDLHTCIFIGNDKEKLIVGKSRNGPVGDVDVDFHGDFISFASPALPEGSSKGEF